MPLVSANTGCGLDEYAPAATVFFNLPNTRSSGSSARVEAARRGRFAADGSISLEAPTRPRGSNAAAAGDFRLEALGDVLGDPLGDPNGDPSSTSSSKNDESLNDASASLSLAAARVAPGAGRSLAKTAFGSNALGSQPTSAMTVDENTAAQFAVGYAADLAATFSARVTRISAVNADIDTSRAARMALIIAPRRSRRSSCIRGSVSAFSAARHSELAR
mmetsp:Transcript_8505/g.34804  ORF Transcript_8505/g.34804 Transcript_8505/m.34804 type:complete len:219 (-) Transcript_8505:2044-2700(-)